jgi:hypothetical protein
MQKVNYFYACSIYREKSKACTCFPRVEGLTQPQEFCWRRTSTTWRFVEKRHWLVRWILRYLLARVYRYRAYNGSCKSNENEEVGASSTRRAQAYNSPRGLFTLYVRVPTYMYRAFSRDGREVACKYVTTRKNFCAWFYAVMKWTH